MEPPTTFCRWRSDRTGTTRARYPARRLGPGDVDRPLVCLQTNERSAPDKEGKHTIVLEPYGYRWFRFGGLDELVLEPGSQH